MSLKDLKQKSVDALGEAPVQRDAVTRERRPVTAPGATALMQPTIDALNDRARKAERLVAELEAKVQDMAKTMISVGSVVPNPWQPRRVFDEGKLRKLADSIAETGLIQPIVVRRRVQSLDTAAQGFELVAGERRWRAHQLLGKAEIKAAIVEASDADMALMSLAENLDREDLTDFEASVAIRRAETEFPDRKGMALALGMERSDLYRYLAFQNLPAYMLEDLGAQPALLGRVAASDIVAALKKGGAGAEQAARAAWQRLKAGTLDQTKIAGLIAADRKEGGGASGERDIRKLFVGKEQAGSITRDAKSLTVKIRAAALTPERERRIRILVERALRDEGPSEID